MLADVFENNEPVGVVKVKDRRYADKSFEAMQIPLLLARQRANDCQTLLLIDLLLIGQKSNPLGNINRRI